MVVRGSGLVRGGFQGRKCFLLSFLSHPDRPLLLLRPSLVPSRPARSVKAVRPTGRPHRIRNTRLVLIARCAGWYNTSVCSVACPVASGPIGWPCARVSVRTTRDSPRALRPFSLPVRPSQPGPLRHVAPGRAPACDRTRRRHAQGTQHVPIIHPGGRATTLLRARHRFTASHGGRFTAHAGLGMRQGGGWLGK